MKILAIDTASNICGVSILNNNILVCKLDSNSGKTHSENLMPMIQEAFLQTNLNIQDINLIVCDKGPGSFTGIRIGIATVKAFCDALDINCIGISSLKALAYNIKTDGYICSLIDCKNDNAYFALYELKNNKYIEVISPSTDSIENILQKLINYQCSITFVGDGSEIYKDKIIKKYPNANFASNNQLDSYHLGLAGFDDFMSNKIDDVLPLYLKKPQAQRQLEEKLKNNLN